MGGASCAVGGDLRAGFWVGECSRILVYEDGGGMLIHIVSMVTAFVVQD